MVFLHKNKRKIRKNSHFNKFNFQSLCVSVHQYLKVKWNSINRRGFIHKPFLLWTMDYDRYTSFFYHFPFSLFKILGMKKKKPQKIPFLYQRHDFKLISIFFFFYESRLIAFMLGFHSMNDKRIQNSNFRTKMNFWLSFSETTHIPEGHLFKRRKT